VADLDSVALAAWGQQPTFCENGLRIKRGNGYDMMLTDAENKRRRGHIRGGMESRVVMAAASDGPGIYERSCGHGHVPKLPNQEHTNEGNCCESILCFAILVHSKDSPQWTALSHLEGASTRQSIGAKA